jgi:hypothetical protein
MSPAVGPTHWPELSTIVVPFTVIDLGLMSPETLPATSAYGTLVRACRGAISASPPTVSPR